uniref:Uncharacterized protein n=1 Tax=Romanomermis culicivorax TaxID=13658 RepID=A0A915L935_ROMCU
MDPNPAFSYNELQEGAYFWPEDDVELPEKRCTRQYNERRLECFLTSADRMLGFSRPLKQPGPIVGKTDIITVTADRNQHLDSYKK